MSKLRTDQLETLDGLHTKNVEDLVDDINVAQVTTSTGEQALPDALDLRVIYVETVADLQALDTSGLVDGQQASVGEAGLWEFVSGQWSPKNSETITVNIPSDYPTLQAAIEALSNFKMGSGSEVVLLIESGHQITNGVFINNSSCHGMRISSEDEVVYLDDEFDGVDYPGDPNYTETLFLGINCTMPVLDCKIDMENRFGPGYYIDSSSTGFATQGSGIINAGLHGLMVRASIFSGPGTDWSGANGVGCRAQGGAQVYVQGANFDDCAKLGTGFAEAAVRASRGSLIQCINSTARNSGMDGYRAIRGEVVAQGSDASFAARTGFVAFNGGRMNAQDATATDCAERGLWVSRASVCTAGDADFRNAGEEGVMVERASLCDVGGADVSGAGSHGLFADRGSRVNALQLQALNCIGDGIRAESGSHISAPLSDVQGSARGLVATRGSFIEAGNSNCRVGGQDSSTDIVIQRGSTIAAQDSTGGTSEVPVTLTLRGIIYK